MLVRFRTPILLRIAAVILTAILAAPFAVPAFAQGCCYTEDDCQMTGSSQSFCVYDEFCETWLRYHKCGPIGG